MFSVRRNRRPPTRQRVGTRTPALFANNASQVLRRAAAVPGLVEYAIWRRSPADASVAMVTPIRVMADRSECLAHMPTFHVLPYVALSQYSIRDAVARQSKRVPPLNGAQERRCSALQLAQA